MLKEHIEKLLEVEGRVRDLEQEIEGRIGLLKNEKIKDLVPLIKRIAEIGKDLIYHQKEVESIGQRVQNLSVKMGNQSMEAKIDHQ